MPETNIHVAGDRVVGLDCFPTPGHARHHVCYLDGDGVLYAGDAAGVRIQPGSFVLPPTPPPDIDLEAWEATLDEIERRAPERLALIHFGVAEDVRRHVEELRRRLREWGALVESGATQEEFVEHVRRELADTGEPSAPYYERAMPLDQSYAGLKRYWEKRREAAA